MTSRELSFVVCTVLCTSLYKLSAYLLCCCRFEIPLHPHLRFLLIRRQLWYCQTINLCLPNVSSSSPECLLLSRTVSITQAFLARTLVLVHADQIGIVHIQLDWQSTIMDGLLDPGARPIQLVSCILLIRTKSSNVHYTISRIRLFSLGCLHHVPFWYLMSNPH